MKFKKLGRTEIMVSEICLGSMTWGSQNSKSDVHQQLDYAIGEGVNFIDTAEMYPTTPRKPETSGLSEELLGTWLKNRPDRDKLVVSTKVTGAGDEFIREGKRVNGQILREAVEGSLNRLQTDRIDLYHLHWPNRGSYHFRRYWTFDARDLETGDMDQEVADILGEVARLQQEGKLRSFGLSSETAWGTMKFLEIGRKFDLPRIEAIQNEYSLICRIFDLDMAEVSIQEDIGLMAFSPLAMGSLTGKYLDGNTQSGSRASMFPDLKGRFVPQTEMPIRRYQQIAKKHGLNLAQMALAFCLTRPFMMSIIVGATSLEHIKSNIAAKDILLTEEVLADIQLVYRDHPMPM